MSREQAIDATTFTPEEKPLITQVMNIFRKPSARMVAQEELEDAERALLAYQAHLEQSKYMVLRYEDTVKRLRRYLREEQRSEPQ